ncbi:MAG: hypothetical protein GF368_00985 [Candidatus Aenigmarchaeota archaeon]|nr:hypothetical protein [Candidatus Aenigmarchaeota archaeon]
MSEIVGVFGLGDLMGNDIEKIIKEFNELRSPVATAELVSNKKNDFKVRFTGAFCRTCGFYDYFDDLKILLEDNNLKTKIGKIKEIEKGATVKFEKLKNNN